MARGVPDAGEPPVLFLRANTPVILLVFLLVSTAIDDENIFKFKWLWHQALAGQGHHPPSKASVGRPIPRYGLGGLWRKFLLQLSNCQIHSAKGVLSIPSW